MSHDVDLIVTRGELGILERMVDDLSESHHLAGTKWRATWRSIHLDLYAPFQSRLGANLQLRVELLTSHAETVNGYRVLTSAAHTATKIAALLDRPDSLPGRKDRLRDSEVAGGSVDVSDPVGHRGGVGAHSGPDRQARARRVRVPDRRARAQSGRLAPGCGKRRAFGGELSPSIWVFLKSRQISVRVWVVRRRSL